MSHPSPAPIRPHDAFMLNVGDGHWIYAEKIGVLDGTPAVFLHGGPGSGAQHSHRNIFNPQRFSAVLFDQRGAGRSHPYLSTIANTTQRQIEDLEQLRLFLNVDRWIVVGGSWGSTLALAYAQAHPDRVTGLVLRAVFLGTDAEVQWAFVEGPKRFRPELYSAFVDALPADEREDPIAAYLGRLTNADPAVHGPAAHLWHAYERALSELSPRSPDLPNISLGQPMPSTERIPPTPIMEAHYIRNHFFLEPDQLLHGMGKLRDIPGIIVQGRYDLLCPPVAAEAVARRWPLCQLRIIDAAGHAMTEPGVSEAMHRALLDLV